MANDPLRGLLGLLQTATSIGTVIAPIYGAVVVPIWTTVGGVAGTIVPGVGNAIGGTIGLVGGTAYAGGLVLGVNILDLALQAQIKSMDEAERRAYLASLGPLDKLWLALVHLFNRLVGWPEGGK